MADLLDVLDVPGRLRYGVPTSEKESLARRGSLPGAPQDSSESQSIADRYASGYLFGRTWPTVAPILMPAIDALKTSSLPLFGGDSPELQSNASAGMIRAIQDQMVAESGRRDPSSLAAFTSAPSQAAALRRPTPQPGPAPPSFRR